MSEDNKTCENCAHCEEVIGDSSKCELNDYQISAPIPEKCIFWEGK